MRNVKALQGFSLLVLGVLGAGGGSPLSAQAAPSTLTGLWRFNPEKSDQPGDRPEMRQSGGYGPGLPPGAGRNGGIPSGGRGEPLPDPTILLGFMRPVLQILIRQSDSTVDISDATGQIATFHIDGRKVREPQLVGDDLEISARWKDGRLTIERKFPSIGTLKETYFIDPATRQMIIQVKLSGSRLPRGIESRRVYDLSPGGT